MTRYSIPQNKEQLSEWLKCFSEDLLKFGIQTGLSPAEVAALNALVLSVIDDLSKNESEDREQKKEGLFYFMFKCIEKMKQHPKFEKCEFRFVLNQK